MTLLEALQMNMPGMGAYYGGLTEQDAHTLGVDAWVARSADGQLYIGTREPVEAQAANRLTDEQLAAEVG